MSEEPKKSIMKKSFNVGWLVVAAVVIFVVYAMNMTPTKPMSYAEQQKRTESIEAGKAIANIYHVTGGTPPK